MDERERTLWHGAYLFSAVYLVGVFGGAIILHLAFARDCALASMALTAFAYALQASVWRTGLPPWYLLIAVALSHLFAAAGGVELLWVAG